jgi:D-amino-acid dehydrogenase
MAGFDAIVVGGGVVGLSTAYHLVQAGAKTLLVDKGHAGRATDAGAGILSAAADTAAPDPYDRFAAQAARYYPRLIDRLAAEGAGDTGYAVCGSLTVAVNDDEMVAFEQMLTSLRSQAEGWSELSSEEARALFPPLARVRGAIHCRHHARIDGRLLAAALREVALAHGLEVREAEVSDLSVEHGAVRSVAIDGETLPAGHVVIAAGAWSRSLGERIGVLIPVAPQRGQIVHLSLPDTDTGGWPIVRAFRDHYMVPWPGRLVVGATRESVGFCAAHHACRHHGGDLRSGPGGAGPSRRRACRGAGRPAAGKPRRPADPGPSAWHPEPPFGDRARRGRPAARPLQRQGDRRCHHPGRSGRRPRAVRAGPLALT